MAAVTLVLALTSASCLAPAARDEAEELAAQSRTSDIVPSFVPAEDAASDASTPAPGTETPPDTDGATSPPATPVPAAGAEEAEDTPVTSPDDPAQDDSGATDDPGDPSPPAPTPPDPAPSTSSVDDAAGDVTASLLDDPPDHADLRAARVTLQGDAFEVVVTLGGEVPQRQSDPDRTMNVAWFADVDGDGVVDHEVWLNLADDGWFPGHRDNQRQQASFGSGTGIEVEVRDRDLVVRFGRDLLGTDAFRWAVASEWGRYETLGTEAAARDSAPEDHASVNHPQSA